MAENILPLNPFALRQKHGVTAVSPDGGLIYGIITSAGKIRQKRILNTL